MIKLFKIFSLVIIIPLFICNTKSDKIVYKKINTYSFEQLDSLQKIENRKVLVFVYADWCKYCLFMEDKTFKDNKVVDKLNKDYYFITLNTEYKEDITYNKHTFKFKYTGINLGIHELVEELVKINNEINYPSICVLDKNNIIFNHCGYLKPKEILLVL
tara:strand:+ start:3878 stop:4354 length:477 start_codon:yes stop_codon:yes gene_type:complete